MIVKLKCVDNVDKYDCESVFLTVGKVYDGLISIDKEFSVIDDVGDLITDCIEDAYYGKWEVVK